MLEPNRQPPLSRLLRPWRRAEPRLPARAQPADDDHPLRAELLSVEQLRRHFRDLAGWHRVVEKRWRTDPLLDRLDENAAVLAEVNRGISAAASAKQRLAPAAEWLLDNDYLIEEQIRTARRHFPRSYNRQLPKLANGPLSGYARAYILAYQLIIHVDGRVDAGSLAAAIGAYQELQPLKLGELWAIPIMLRLALIENLRRVAQRVSSGREHGDAAERWAQRLLDLAEHKPTELVVGLADLSRSMDALSAPFVADLSRRIQGRHPGMALVVSWIEQRLSEHGATIDQLVQAETQAQAADQVSVGHAIGSLRFLGALDWREFVESQSAVEHALRDDPADVYGDMDFVTRDRYRHEVERVARRSPLGEPEVAQLAAALARKATSDGDDARRRHVGWWLVDAGIRELERAAAMRRPLGLSLARLARRQGLLLYLGGIAALCAGTMWVAGLWAAGQAFHPAVIVAWMLLAGLCASPAAVALANWVCALLLEPRPLPRLDFTEGVPSHRRSLVAVPCLLRHEAEVDELLDAMEVRYVANRDPEVAFALVSDFADAPTEEMPSDAALLKRAVDGIAALNAKYGDEDTPFPFMLLHRQRAWCAGERAWIGRERKRGKLEDLDRALRASCDSGDAPPPGFSAFVGDRGWLQRVRYVLPLDADTQLPMDTVRKLVGAMAHPLNRPLHDPRTSQVARGHALLQPRVAVSLPSAARSRWARLSALDPGIDPYTRAVSDLYQDLFGEGSYIGKGIYDVEAFETALRGRVPPGRVLSHDLLEGCFVRSGLLSDVLLFEDTPARYLADAARRHRWIRGDWQIAAWLSWRAPSAKGRARNPLSWLSQWKILDNLRRSLVPAALVAWIGWCFVVDARPWLLLPLSAFLLPPALSLLRELCGKSREVELAHHLHRVGSSAALQIAQAACQLAFVAHEAVYSLDATLRAWWRLLISRRRLLEWKTAAEAEREARTGLRGTWSAMGASPALALGIGAAVAVLCPVMLIAAAPLLLAWFGAPALAWWLSRPLPDRVALIGAEDALWLRARARRTWRWFETFASGEHHWLPPDNYQEHPTAVVAARTSPTNIGCAALCQLAAHDFGYLAGTELSERLERLLGTIERLERYHGHLYNWYDTRTLRPLTPLYVSTVDSGNLCGHLLTLAAGIDELPRAPLVSRSALEGLRDTAACWREALREAPALAQLERIDAALVEHHPSLGGTHLALDALGSAVRELLEVGDDDARWWASAFSQACQRWQEEIAQLAPWVLVGQPSGEWESPPEEVYALRVALANLDAEPPSLERIANLDRELAPRFAAMAAAVGSGAMATWLEAISRQLAEGARRARARLAAVAELAARCRALAAHDFTFLYDRSRDLFAIGYNASDHRLDASFYDLLASEARLASYIAVAQGQVKQEHWFALGRLLTAPGLDPALLSWSGSMFEYLMPLLVMPDHPHTLLHRTFRAVIARQIDFARGRAVPWGISESGYNATDAQLNYQYRAFGVPGLGLKRGLGEDLVVAPYASALALMVAPLEATRNLRRLHDDGREGRYGFFEAVDYTPTRLPPGQKAAVVRSWMAHHQGMAFLSFTHVLLGRPMQRRFHADPLFRAADLLLHEKVPKAQGPIFPHADDAAPRRPGAVSEPAMRVFTSPSTALPEVHLLSNGRYHVMVTAGGGGSSRWRDLAVTRWREDWARDAWGQFLYLRDRESGSWWSAAHQPAGRPTKRYEAVFTQGRAEFKRRDRDIDSHLEIAVSPEDDIELRRITLINSGDATRVIELTTYAEVVIAPPAADLAHPAFSNLFVRTEIVPGMQAILCTRRGRSPGERPPWMFHLVAVEEGVEDGEPWYETSRFRFLGRGRTPHDPQAMAVERLSGAEGSVLDPVVAVRRALRIAPDTVARFDVVTGMAETREAAMAMIEKYRERRIAERVFELAWTHSQVVLRQLNADEAGAQLYGRLAAAVVFSVGARRAERGLIAANRRGQPGLWGYGISGDLPIALLRVSDPERLAIVVELARAHAYWRAKGLSCDLVILVEDRSVYRQPLHEQVQALVSAVPGVSIDRPGGIFVRRLEQVPAEDRVLVQAAARIVLSDTAGTLAEQLARRPRPEHLPPHLPLRATAPLEDGPDLPPRRDLVFDNGIGGFTRDGKEYVMTLRPGQATPAPWANVLANAGFGTVVDEGGAAYSWAENCHEFRLTAWHNDAVTGAGGEALWLRDDERGDVWSPSPYPARDHRAYIVRHGFGYSVFEHARGGIESEMWVYVAVDAPVKITLVKLRNRSGRRRRLSVAAYCELVLGELRHRHAPHVVTALDPRTGALIATNAWNSEFAGRVAFLDVSEVERSVTGDRLEFIGRNGGYQRPAALGRQRLSNQVGAGLDPCFAALASIDLDDGQEREVAFVLGAGKDLGETQALAGRFHGVGAARAALDAVWQFWNRTIGVLRIETPEPELDLLANGWLVYQTLACRFWARSGFYQSGGAYGFRDQLQDSLALLHAAPHLTREHLLRAAMHQFAEGDVLHWWHPPQDRGVRTHFSDDYLWLPYAVCKYVEATADTGVLDEPVPFLEGRPLLPEEEARYDLWARSGQTASLWEHCLRAVRHGLRFGPHGLPLMGCGDWNDGMNLVGIKGRGESVWLAFFLCDVLARMGGRATSRGEAGVADELAQARAQLGERIGAEAWDGEWYRRAWFDDGTPLGSRENPECQIDALPQSWAVLSGVGDPERARRGMTAAYFRLVDHQAGLVKLFDPPFDRSALEPGYIKGYVPGVRENGGQYTHAAVWTAMAFAELGDRERAWELTRMMNPVAHGRTAEDIARYQVEPYVATADVYAVSPHAGRGGWSWYTGSAGWMYRLMTESLLGLRLRDARLAFAPRTPDSWSGFKAEYRHHGASYHIEIARVASRERVHVTLDGVEQPGDDIALVDDAREHRVRVEHP